MSADVAELHPIYAPLDAEIAPLIHGMNALDWLSTVSSCFGHDQPPHEHWYVAFWCHKDHIGALTRVLNGAAQACDPAQLLDLQIVWWDEVAEAQCDAEPDWLSCDLSLVVPLSSEDREKIVTSLAALFNGQMQGT